MNLSRDVSTFSMIESVEHDFGPKDKDSYCRALYHQPPKHFHADSLPATKFQKRHRFGLRIYPLLGDSIITTTTASGIVYEYYDVWRTWDDCLYLQEILETQYAVKSLEKRRRLRAGKGVKKNGMYIHDRASSFESLPPGPDPNSVAKDIHQYLPRLSRRGTFFRPNKATINQREREFSALIKAFFEKDVPSLIRELRDDGVIRDFFGCWLADHDLMVRRNGEQPTIAADNVSDKFSQFSTSSSPSSHSLPHARFPPVSPSNTQSSFSRSFPTRNTSPSTPSWMSTDGAISEDGYGTDGRSWTSSSNSSSLLSSPTFSSYTTDSRPRDKSHISNSDPPSQTKGFDVTSDFPLFLSSSTRDLLPSRPVPHPPTHVPQRLGTLPEGVELGSPVTVSSSPIPRNRKLSPIRIDSPHRKCVVWQDVDEVFSSEDDAHDQDPLTPVDGTVLNATAETKPTLLPSASALSSLSFNDNYSSPDPVRPCSTCSDGSRVEFDFPLVTDRESFFDPNFSISPPTTIRDSSGVHRSRPGGRPRSISQPLPLLVTAAIPTDVGDDCSIDLGEDLLETYFGGAEPFFSPSEDGTVADNDTFPNYPLSDVPDDPPESPVAGFSMHWQEVPDRTSSVDRPTRGYHAPRSALPPSKSPLPQTAATPVVSSVPRNETLVVKAVLDSVTIVFSAQRDITLTELHQRLHDKFAQTEVTLLPGAFALAYVPPSVNPGGKHMRTMSSASVTSVDWAHALPLQNEEDWTAVATSCVSKITLRVSYHVPQ